MCNNIGQVPGTLIDWAAGVVGIPCAVVSAQITQESGGQLGVTSSAGAQGPAQFEPSTWASLGCAGSPFTANDAMKCYAKYMYQLVQQFHGNVRDALAAYNAGPGNLQAGYGYADTILNAAGQGSGLQAGAGDPNSALTPAQTQAATAGADCAFSLGGQHIGILFGHGPSLPSVCLIQKSEVRAFLGGLILVGGALVLLPGIIIVIAFGFKASGAAAAVGQAASVVPGPYGKAVSMVTGGGRGRTPAAAAARARSAGVGAPATQQQARQANRNRRTLQQARGQAPTGP